MKPTIATITEYITIRETPRGWLNKHTGRYYKAAVFALRAIHRDAKRRAGSHRMVISFINWETTTRAGSAVVCAITKP